MRRKLRVLTVTAAVALCCETAAAAPQVPPSVVDQFDGHPAAVWIVIDRRLWPLVVAVSVAAKGVNEAASTIVRALVG